MEKKLVETVVMQSKVTHTRRVHFAQQNLQEDCGSSAAATRNFEGERGVGGTHVESDTVLDHNDVDTAEGWVHDGPYDRHAIHE